MSDITVEEQELKKNKQAEETGNCGTIALFNLSLPAQTQTPDQNTHMLHTHILRAYRYTYDSHAVAYY